MREKLIELLQESIDENLEPDDPYVGVDVNYEQIADYLAANGVTLAKWIPVTERLPEKNGAFLVRWENKSVGDAEYERIYGSFGCWMDLWPDEEVEWMPFDGITHWMPLPEPPKGE